MEAFKKAELINYFSPCLFNGSGVGIFQTFELFIYNCDTISKLADPNVYNLREHIETQMKKKLGDSRDSLIINKKLTRNDSDSMHLSYEVGFRRLMIECER